MTAQEAPGRPRPVLALVPTFPPEAKGNTLPKIEDLPFVSDDNPRGPGRCFWSVQPAEDHEAQWEQGERFALAALEYMAFDKTLPPGSLLVAVMGDMHRQGDCTGVERGFMDCIGTFAAHFRRAVGDGFYRAYMRQREKMEQARCEREAQGRSDRARHAARARWAKAKGDVS